MTQIPLNDDPSAHPDSDQAETAREPVWPDTPQFEAVSDIPVFGKYSKALAGLTCSAQIEKGYVPAIAIDYSDNDNFIVRAASVAGGGHRLARRVRQDSFAIAEPDEGLLIIAVADGLGSLPHSHWAASFACQAVSNRIIDLLSANRDLSALRAEDVLSPVNDGLFKLQNSLSTDIATTLVAAAISAEIPEEAEAWLILIGDSWVAVLSQTPEGDPDWRFIFSGKLWEEVVTTITPAIPYQPLQYEHKLMPIYSGTALFLLTDGLSLPLEISTSVREGLGQRWLKPPSPLDFASHLSFNRRGELDDRTAVGVWLQP